MSTNRGVNMESTKIFINKPSKKKEKKQAS